MNPHLVTVANSFYVGAVLLGVPSFVSTILYAYSRVRLLMAPAPAPSSFGSVKNPDAILMILDGMTRTIGAAASLIGGLSQGIFGLIAVVSAAVLMFAVALFLTGRGLHAHAGWARVLGGVLMAGLLLASLLSLAAVRGPFLLLALLSVTGSIYALWGYGAVSPFEPSRSAERGPCNWRGQCPRRALAL